VKVSAYQVGLVFKGGVFEKMLPEGNYWFWRRVDVQVYDITKGFNAPVELNILLDDPLLASVLQIVEVKDSEIVLQYKEGILTEVLTAGRYAFWKGPVRYEFVKADLSKAEITEPVDRATLANKLVAPYVRTITVESYEKAVLFMDGKYVQVLESGVYHWWRNIISIHVGKADMR